MRSTLAATGGMRLSFALIASYVFDWIVIIIEAVIGYVFGIHSPNKRPFSLNNMDITYPFADKETISTAVLFVVALIIPAVIIFLVALLLVPGSSVSRSTPKSLIWQRKGWEWFAGWTGLALSLATAFMITSGMKNLFGHWRPDLLGRCQPDVANIAKYAVGGFPNTADGSYLVSVGICTTTDMENLDDGFRSFPSGHASFSAAGLIYLSLFLASKLAIVIPFLAPQAYRSNNESYYSAFPSRLDRKGIDHSADSHYKGESMEMGAMGPSSQHEAPVAARNQAAAPPVYLLIFVAIPLLTAIYITSTRYSDFRHHGFDLLFGFFLGTVTAVFSFRFYHLPISQGAGWAWGPRSRDRAWWAGIGVGSYASSKTEHENAMTNGATNGDLENGSGLAVPRPMHGGVAIRDPNLNGASGAYAPESRQGLTGRNGAVGAPEYEQGFENMETQRLR